MNPATNKVRYARTLTHLLLAFLIASFCVWQVSRPTGPSVFFWVVQLLPLVILIPGLRRGNPRTYIWLCFVLLAYFIKGVDGIVSPSRAWIDYVTLAVSVVLFITAMITSRWISMIPRPVPTPDASHEAADQIR